jgi:hypothetical protein
MPISAVVRIPTPVPHPSERTVRGARCAVRFPASSSSQRDHAAAHSHRRSPTAAHHAHLCRTRACPGITVTITITTPVAIGAHPRPSPRRLSSRLPRRIRPRRPLSHQHGPPPRHIHVCPSICPPTSNPRIIVDAFLMQRRNLFLSGSGFRSGFLRAQQLPARHGR